MTTVMRATFDGKVLVPEGPVDLPVGKVLEVDVREAAELRPGSPALLLRLMRESPPISAEDAAALMQAIEEGQTPATDAGIFDDFREENDPSRGQRGE